VNLDTLHSPVDTFGQMRCLQRPGVAPLGSVVYMATQAEKARTFLELHHAATPLLMPNPWDAGAARILQSIGFPALATTSSGFAATLGRLDGQVTRDEAIAHGGAIAAAVDVPVSADLENCFADDPAGVAETVRLAVAAGLCGGSVEDYSGSSLYDVARAAERVAAAADAAHAGDVHYVLTARAENHIRGNPDLADTIARLQAYQEAGADVLFAPGLSDLDDIRRVVSSVDRPVNILAGPNAPTVAELGSAGVRRISVGGAFTYVALNALADAGRELLEHGTYGYWEKAGPGMKMAREVLKR
jgi:2-methylisocitrate lyase-like PEP mutase family enzyme